LERTWYGTCTWLTFFTINYKKAFSRLVITKPEPVLFAWSRSRFGRSEPINRSTGSATLPVTLSIFSFLYRISFFQNIVPVLDLFPVPDLEKLLDRFKSKVLLDPGSVGFLRLGRIRHFILTSFYTIKLIQLFDAKKFLHTSVADPYDFFRIRI